MLLIICLCFSYYSHGENASGSIVPNKANKVLLLGDSIGAGYGVAENESWGAMLKKYFSGQNRVFVNASISGETTAGGLSRLPGLLQQHQPELVIIELGGNDGLRGYPIKHLKKNINTMIELAKKNGANVYLLGMLIPPNYGPIYNRLFQRVYTDAAAQYNVALLPFVLDNIAVDKSLMQADGIHPNSKAQKTLFENVVSKLPTIKNPPATQTN